MCIEYQKYLFGIIREIGINGDTFAVECKMKDGESTLTHWVNACAKIPQEEVEAIEDEDFDIEMKQAPTMPTKEVNLTAETFRLHVNSFVTQQRQIWKKEIQQVRLLKQVEYNQDQLAEIMKSVDLPLQALPPSAKCQQLMNIVWNSKFIAFYEHLVAKTLPEKAKDKLLSDEQQNILMKSVMDDGFKNFNDSLVQWNVDVGTSGAWLF